MAKSNISNLPPKWDEAQLEEHSERSLDVFVERRLAEPADRYSDHLRDRRRSIHRLLRALHSVDSNSPDIDLVRNIILDSDLLNALRYVAGPPISEDDLGVLVTRSTSRMTKKSIKDDPHLATEVLALICRLADSERFPWLQHGRPPRVYELKQAIRATTSMHAAQRMQTERRGFGKEVEAALAKRLHDLGFEKIRTPNKGKITAPVHLPAKGTFYGECTLYGRRADLLIGLPDGRCVAVEAKDSSSVVNSVKRVLNDTVAKAKKWQGELGNAVIPVALLSGVFGLDNLKNAQSGGLFLIWAHDLETFVAWLASQ